MLADRVRIGRNKEKIEYIGEVYLAQDNDFVKVNNRWIYRGSELEIEIPRVIQGEKITTYDYMFYGTGTYLATPVTRVDSNNKNVTSMSSMFQSSKATTLDLSNFDTSNVTNMTNMFANSSATTLDLSSFDTSNVTDMYSMFYNSRATTLDLSSFDTSNVTDMAEMFHFASATTGYARTQADADKFNASSNKPTALTFTVPLYLATDGDFSGTSSGSFKYIGTETELEMPHVIKGVPVTSYSNLFYSTQGQLVTKVVSTNSGVTSMGYMFYYSQATTLDLSNFDTSSVTDMRSMFYYSQATTLDVSSFDTSGVTNMSSMFRNSKATTLDLSSFDTSSVTDMSSMFRNSKATTGYARTQTDANKFNASSNKPTALSFVVKP